MSLIPTIIAAGTLGGGAYCLVNYHPAYAGKPEEQWIGTASWTRSNFIGWLWKLWVAVVLGNAAAFTVPVFLHATSSDLIRELVEPPRPVKPPKPNQVTPPAGADHQSTNSVAWYVFFGFCVLAAYAAQRFLQAMLGHVLKELEQQRTRVDQIEKTAETAQHVAEEVAEDFSEPETAAAAAAPALPLDLTAEEQRILAAFQKARTEKQWMRRSKEGLAADTGLTEEQVLQGLDRLVSLGLVQKRPGRGRAGWLLTATGVAWHSPTATLAEANNG